MTPEEQAEAAALTEHLREKTGLELSPEQISGQQRVGGVWWIKSLTDKQREDLAQRILYGLLNRVSANEKVAVLNLALQEASSIDKRTRKNGRTERIWGPFFLHEIDGITAALGSSGKQEADLCIAFDRIRKLRPEYRKYKDATLRREYLRAKGRGSSKKRP